MTREELIEEAFKFEKKNKTIIWNPKYFPEDITEEGALDELVSQGNYMYESLKKAIELIHDLTVELASHKYSWEVTFG